MTISSAIWSFTRKAAPLALAVMLPNCSKKEADENEASDDQPRTKSVKPPPSTPSASEGEQLLADKTQLSSLPNLIGAGGRINETVLEKLGIRRADQPEVSRIALNAVNSAKELRRTATASLHFPVGEEVKIEPLSEAERSVIVEDFTNALRSDLPDIAPDSLAILLREQLHRQFGLEMSATLHQSDIVRVPPELRGLMFSVKQRRGDGALETFNVDPVQAEDSEFFFLNAASK